MSTPNLDAMGNQWVSTLVWFTFELEYQKGCDNIVADVLSQVTTQLDPERSEIHSWWSHLKSGISCQSPWPSCSGRWPMFGTRSMYHHRPPIGGYACYWLGQRPERGPNVEWSVGLAEGTEADRFEDSSDRTYLQWRGQCDLKELAEFHSSSGGPVPMIYAKRQNRRPPALHGPQGTPYCHSQWMPLRSKSSGAQSYPFFVVGRFLVARNYQPGTEVHKILHALLAAWG